jgi:hypothetical protein
MAAVLNTVKLLKNDFHVQTESLIRRDNKFFTHATVPPVLEGSKYDLNQVNELPWLSLIF